MTDKELIIKISEDCFEELKCVELNESNEGVVFHAIKCILNGVPLPKGQGKLIERVLKAAEALKQEPKAGHWVEDGTKRNFLDTDIRRGVEMKRYLGKGYHTYINEECSVCRKVTIHDDSIAYAYCPHCGAKMIESDEESEAAE